MIVRLARLNPSIASPESEDDAKDAAVGIPVAQGQQTEGLLLTVTHNTVSSDLIAICWALWGIVWLAGAIYNARHAPTVQRRSNRAYLWIAAIVAWLVVVTVPAAVWRRLSVHSFWLATAGAVLLVLGTAFTLWARTVLGTMWSAAVVTKDEHRLRTGGPYGITRHPIYTGMLTMLIGSTLLGGLGRWLSGLVLGTAVILVKIFSRSGC